MRPTNKFLHDYFNAKTFLPFGFRKTSRTHCFTGTVVNIGKARVLICFVKGFAKIKAKR